MNIFLIYFTEAGGETCRRIERALTEDGHRCISSEGRGLPGGLARWTETAFTKGEALIFVSATGIAVRAIAPYIKAKTSDPAVIVTDERGQHVISLLSGHMGGANELTRRIARAIGGAPVITTATDVNGRFAVDEWAKKQGLAIADMKLAKEVSAALLRNEQVGLWSEFPIDRALPEGLEYCESHEKCKTRRCALGIAIAGKEPKELPFDSVLWLMPKNIVLGIGCRRNVSKERIASFVQETLHFHGLREAAVCGIASIDLKKDEQGLLAYAQQLKVPFWVYSAEELRQVENPQAEGRTEKESFASSDFVKSVTGVDNVCERAAICAALQQNRGLPELIIKKHAGNGVTTAAVVCGQQLSLKMT